MIPGVKGALVRLSLTEDNGILTAPKSCTFMDSVKLWRLSNFQATAVLPGGAGLGVQEREDRCPPNPPSPLSRSPSAKMGRRDPGASASVVGSSDLTQSPSSQLPPPLPSHSHAGAASSSAISRPCLSPAAPNLRPLAALASSGGEEAAGGSGRCVAVDSQGRCNEEKRGASGTTELADQAEWSCPRQLPCPRSPSPR